MEKTFVEFNGKRYDISGKLIAQRTMWGYPKWYHRITVKDGEHTTVFPFYTPDNVLNDYELRFSLYCLLSDAIAYRNAKDKNDFAEEFGYEIPEPSEPVNTELESAWKGCKSASKKCENFDSDIYEFADYLQETYSL